MQGVESPKVRTTELPGGLEDVAIDTNETQLAEGALGATHHGGRRANPSERARHFGHGQRTRGLFGPRLQHSHKRCGFVLRGDDLDDRRGVEVEDHALQPVRAIGLQCTTRSSRSTPTRDSKFGEIALPGKDAPGSDESLQRGARAGRGEHRHRAPVLGNLQCRAGPNTP